MINSNMSRVSLDRQNMIHIVEIFAMNTNATPYPYALGRDYTGAEFTINLRILPLGLQSLPNIGDVWYIELRFGRFWTLLNKETDIAVGLDPGDPLV